MKKIRIGFLSPYSSINPSMSKQIMDGFFAALTPSLIKARAFEFVPIFIGQGKKAAMVDAVNKLLFFDDVDIISGIINYRAAKEILKTIEKSGKLGFFFDQGENIPTTMQVSERVFFNSLQLWQSQYALGYWAYKEFGDKGLVAIGMYDSGYHLQSSFRQGAIDAGSAEIDYLLFKDESATLNFTPFTDHFYKAVEQVKPAYIHGIFSGTHAIEFINAYNNASFKNSIPLLITAHMASEELLDTMNVAGIKVFSASMYNYHSKSDDNIRFKYNYTALTGQKPSVYALMGYEMGTAFKDIYPSLAKQELNTIAQCLKNQVIKSCRGTRGFYHGSVDSVPIIDIEKIEFYNSHNINKIIVSQGKALQFNNSAFNEIHNENVTGWLNPYLCI